MSEKNLKEYAKVAEDGSILVGKNTVIDGFHPGRQIGIFSHIHEDHTRLFTAALHNCSLIYTCPATFDMLAALEQDVKKVIALSTDKACCPINLYGATKLASDKLFVSANILGGRKESTKFSVVRYGNVLNSRGSVIPLFKKILKSKKNSLPITHKNMTRFFISIKDGIKFVLESFSRMQGGEIFIPKLSSCYIKDIVKALNPNASCHIVGVRPGEKLHEALCIKEESHLTIEFKKHFVIEPTIWEPSVNLRTYMIDKKKEKGKRVAQNFEYNSLKNKDMLDVNGIKKILKKLDSEI